MLSSTGGIIALGLGVKQWTVHQCVTQFVTLCDQAFTPRELGQITSWGYGSKYKTTPFRNALQTAFGEDLLYGGRRTTRLSYTTQVAVTATSGTGETGLVLTNYSRHEESEPSYKFEFPHNLQVWEAANATSAAPTFFKPFVRDRYPHKIYLDGALYYNNPASVANNERKFLWPDVAENPPDILLSLGTGKCSRHLDEQIRKTPGWRRGGPRLIAAMFSVLVSVLVDASIHSSVSPKCINANKIQAKRIDNILNAELEWKRFRGELSDTKLGQEQGSRFVRLNLDLSREPPQMDEKEKLAELQISGAQLLKTDEYGGVVEKIAHMLVASTFYFSKDRFWYNEKSRAWTCIGRFSFHDSS